MTGVRVERSTAADRTTGLADLQAVQAPPVLPWDPLAVQPGNAGARAEGSMKSPGLPVGPGPVELLKGRWWAYTEADRRLAMTIARGQHQASGARGTRGAGASQDLRYRGALGEIAVARMLGIEPQVRVLRGPDREPDIRFQGVAIEVKAGFALVHRRQLLDEALYVAVSGPSTPGIANVVHMDWGRDIRTRNATPPAFACPRDGTGPMNFWFGSHQPYRLPDRER